MFRRGLAGRAFFLGAGYNRLLDARPDLARDRALLLHGVQNLAPQEERDATVIFMNPRLGVPYTAPSEVETGFEEIRNRILRHKPPHADS